MLMQIVIIGLGTAGFAAILAIKKFSRDSEITVIDKKDYLLHSCGLPFALEGKVKTGDLQHSIKNLNIKLIKGEATNIEPKSKSVTANNERIIYDKLIIATGALPFVPNIDGVKNNKKILTLHNIDDTEEIIKRAKTAKNIVVIGAGAIGLEAANALRNKKKDVTVIEALPQCFPKSLDRDMSQIVEEHINKKGIRLLLNEKIKKIDKNEIIAENKKIPYDLMIMATGVRANTKLAESAGIKTSAFGILVNEKLETNIKDIYAAGDCIQINNLINNKPWPSLLANSAYRQGTIAGMNAIGNNLTYKGTLTTFVSVLDELEIAATGFNSYFAKQYSYNIVEAKAAMRVKPEWFDDKKEIALKIIVNKDNKKILGAQAVGYNASSKINILSAAIQAGFSVNDLSNIELAYCPAVSQAYDIIHLVAELALRKLG